MRVVRGGMGHELRWEHDTRPEAPLDSPAICHLVKFAEPDATLCDEYIDTQFAREMPESFEYCAVCVSLARQSVLDRARSDVAQELGVDESEVF